MNKNLGKVLPYDKFIEPDKSTSFQDLFMSACVYIDTKKIKLYIDKKIIISVEHFYALITSYIWKIAKIDHYTRRNGWGTYHNTITGAENVMFSCRSPHDWRYDMREKEIKEILIIFIEHGLNPTKEIYKLLILLDCDNEEIDNLFTFGKEEMCDIKIKFGSKFFTILEIMYKAKGKSKEKKLGAFTLRNLEILCRSNQLTDILECKENSKRVIKFTKECFVNSLFNYNGEVLEYFIQHGFVPQLDHINMILRPDQRFILLLRFYPHVLNMNDPNDIEKINNSIDGKKIVVAENSDSESETDIKPKKVIKKQQSTKKIVHVEFDSDDDSDAGNKKIKSKKK